MPGPRNESPAERFALSNDALKTSRSATPSPSKTALIAFAIFRVWARDSMTQGPAKKTGRQRSPAER